jgi:hypothetical protein
MKKIFAINFTESQLETINQALMLSPYGVAAPLIAYINQQIKEQQALEIDSREDMVAAGS